MRINRFALSLFMLVLVISSIKANNSPISSIDFYKGSLEEAKKKAKADGKLFFVDFYAKWCAPCKWMDETTFVDEGVSKMLNQNYVSMKIDIDEFEGFNLKQEFKIKYLPTFLIFSADGELIDRIEETMSARKLNEILQSHHSNNPEKRKIVPVNTSPSQTKSVGNENETQTESEVNNMAEKSTYRVQVGIYSDFKNTFKYVGDLKEQFAEPIIVLNDYSDGKIVYRVLMGEFKTKNEATSFVKILKQEFGISAIVK